jgi:glycosyltransferase involved in cell wall biosynthesis
MLPNTIAPAARQIPLVSIVIPVYNRAELIQPCLASLISQTYPRDRYEIILVDDGSTDDTVEQARASVQGWPGQFRLVQKANGGPASARNAGFRASSADVIAFIDSDCVAEVHWLEHLIGALAPTDAAGVGGPLVNVAPKSWVAHYLNAAAFFRHRVKHGRVDYLLTANAAFRRSALEDVHGFSEYPGAWAEDADLSFRLTQAGRKLFLAQQGLVTHYGTPNSVRGLVKDLYCYGYGNAVLSRYWKNGRTPVVEFIRHAGAVVLSPLLALSYVRSFGAGWALAFWPLIVMEHSAFLAGLVNGTLRERL